MILIIFAIIKLVEFLHRLYFYNKLKRLRYNKYIKFIIPYFFESIVI
ncbi:hypothetical protein EXM36_10675 [Clostridium botulinum]|nr:hypothetical protein AGE31_10330 [Clostridium botulinum]NFK35304.1 hypothetical protein [Clostridium botulinum H04402 065]MCS6166499.1 hypothetical protein [Clostridium botulinum]NCI19598.1 hypothetical protein [Clostridium botulinum]NCI34211.1 hypothetical protein [Clostridium botulinum]